MSSLPMQNMINDKIIYHCIGRVRHDPSLIPSGPRVYLFDSIKRKRSGGKRLISGSISTTRS